MACLLEWRKLNPAHLVMKYNFLISLLNLPFHSLLLVFSNSMPSTYHSAAPSYQSSWLDCLSNTVRFMYTDSQSDSWKVSRVHKDGAAYGREKGRKANQEKTWDTLDSLIYMDGDYMRILNAGPFPFATFLTTGCLLLSESLKFQAIFLYSAITPIQGLLWYFCVNVMKV